MACRLLVRFGDRVWTLGWSSVALAEDREVVVALVDEGDDVGGGHGADGAGVDDGRALAQSDRPEGADGEVGHRIERRLTQDDLTVDQLGLALPGLLPGLDQERVAVEHAGSLGGGEELEVEVDPLALRGVRARR